jgi:hypothetical protein
MSDADLRAQFEKIADTARTATDKVEAARQRRRDQLEADVATAHESATAAADRMKDQADAARDDGSSDWQEIREEWRAHVVKIQARAHKKKDQLDAHDVATDANVTEAYTYDAMDFAWTRSRKPSTRCSLPYLREPMQRRSNAQRRNPFRVGSPSRR